MSNNSYFLSERRKLITTLIASLVPRECKQAIRTLARLIVVRRLNMDKGQVLQSGILDTSVSLCVLPFKNGLIQLKLVYSVVFEFEFVLFQFYL